MLTRSRPNARSYKEKSGLSHVHYFSVKGGIILTILVVFILLSTVIFMGIEGNHTIARNYDHLLQQLQFNKTYSSGGQAALTYVKEFDGTYQRAFQIANLTCEIARLDLHGWNNKSYVDAGWFSVSMLSTAGWGIYQAKSTTVRAICIVYALFGIPLFAIVIGAVERVLKYSGTNVERSRTITRYCINHKIVALVAVLMFVAGMILYGLIIKEYVNWNCARPITHPIYTTMREKTIAAGQPTDWNLIQGIYYAWINGITLVGFGDVWPYYSHHDNGHEHNHILKIFVRLGHLCVVIFGLACVSLGFESMSNYFEEGLDKKIVKTYSVRRKSEKERKDSSSSSATSSKSEHSLKSVNKQINAEVAAKNGHGISVEYMC